MSHGDEVEVEVVDARFGGTVKMSGISPWIASTRPWSNRATTDALRTACFDHGDDAQALIGPNVAPTPGAHRPSTTRRPPLQLRNPDRYEIDRDSARARIAATSGGRYRGCDNMVLDREGCRTFAAGLPGEERCLVEMVCFVAGDYGGEPARFLENSYLEESRRIAAGFRSRAERIRDVVTTARPRVEEVSSEGALPELLLPLAATKVWLVWATAMPRPRPVGRGFEVQLKPGRPPSCVIPVDASHIGSGLNEST